MAKSSAEVLEEQAAYYRARAPEYDEWWLREGRYDRGAKANAQWRHEVEDVALALRRLRPSGDVLELACGTGWWTERLAQTAARLSCVDASSEVLALNRSRLHQAGLPIPDYREADLFNWTPRERYDVVFFSFWLSHVPADRFDAFWGTIADALKPGGRAFFIDSRPAASSTAANQSTATDAGIQQRMLNDGQSYRVIKVYYEPMRLKTRLQSIGWDAQIHTTENYFLYGPALPIS